MKFTIGSKTTNRPIPRDNPLRDLYANTGIHSEKLSSLVSRWYLASKRANRTTRPLLDWIAILILEPSRWAKSSSISPRLRQPTTTWVPWHFGSFWQYSSHGYNLLNHRVPQVYRQIKELDWNYATLHLGPNLNDKQSLCVALASSVRLILEVKTLCGGVWTAFCYGVQPDATRPGQSLWARCWPKCGILNCPRAATSQYC